MTADQSAMAQNTRTSRSRGAKGNTAGSDADDENAADGKHERGGQRGIRQCGQRTRRFVCTDGAAAFSPAIPKTIGASRPGMNSTSWEVIITVKVARNSGNCCTLRTQ